MDAVARCPSWGDPSNNVGVCGPRYLWSLYIPMCSTLAILSCLPLFYLMLSYQSYSNVSHPIVNLPISLFTYISSAYLDNIDWAAMKWQMFYVYFLIAISKFFWESYCCLYVTLREWGLREISDMLTLSNLASGRAMPLEPSCSPWLFDLAGYSYLRQLS